MSLETPAEVLRQSDSIAKRAYLAKTIDDLTSPSDDLIGLRRYLDWKRDEYAGVYGSDSLTKMQHSIRITRTLIKFKRNELIRESQRPQLEALGYHI